MVSVTLSHPEVPGFLPISRERGVEGNAPALQAFHKALTSPALPGTGPAVSCPRTFISDHLPDTPGGRTKFSGAPAVAQTLDAEHLTYSTPATQGGPLYIYEQPLG